MSAPAGFQGLRVSVERGEKISNKSHMQFPQCGDDNANQMGDLEFSTGTIPPLVSQSETHGKIVIWSSEQQCIDPNIREFEPCQEIHTFLGKRDQVDDDEEEGASLRDCKSEGPMSISSSSTASSSSTGVKRNDNDSNRVDIQRGRVVHKRSASHSIEELDTCLTASVEGDQARSGRAAERDRKNRGLKESKSETNVFVSSLSAVSLSGSLSSALDTSGETRITLPVYKPNLYSSISTTSVQTRRGSAPVDANKNSPPYHSQEKQGLPQYSQDGGLGQRRKAGFEERVLPPRRQQLVRPMCQSEMGRARSLPESSSHQVEAGQVEYPTNRKFTRTSLREPSDFSHLYSSAGVPALRQPNQAAQRETLPLEKQLTSASRPNPSPPNPPTIERRPQTQLTYRRNCSSPNRAATPPHSPLRTPQGSPRRQPSMFIIPRNVPGVVRNAPPGHNPAVTSSAQGYGNSCLRAPVKTSISTTGMAKALPNVKQSPPKDTSPSPKHAPKPKGVRPKIITYVRKNPQFKPQVADGPYQVSSLPSRLSAYTNNQTLSKDASKDKPDADGRGAPVLSASNQLYEKYRQEMQTSGYPQPGMINRGVRPNNTVPPAHAPPGHSHTAPPKLGSKADNFYGTPSDMGRQGSFKGSPGDDPLQARTAAQSGGSGSLLRSSRGLRLGLGAVTRAAPGSVKTRAPPPVQRPTPVMTQPVQPVSPTEKSQDTDDQVFTQHAPVPSPAEPLGHASRSLLPKVNQSGLRPPGYNSSRHPAGRLAAFGFVRSSSVSSVSSAHSADSGASDPPRTVHRLSVSEEPPLHRVTTGPPSAADHQRGQPCRGPSLQPPSTPALPRRYLPAQPRSSPGVGRKEFQRSSEVTRSLPSSPKRLAVVPPKPQSPVQLTQRPSAAVRGSAPPGSPRRVAQLKPQHQEHQEILQREKEEAQQKEKERQEEERQRNEQREEVQRLQGRCEQQETQLKALREELRMMSLGLEAFIITTQHYCLKNNTTEKNERKLSLEIKTIREEIASHSQRWERLHREKTTLETAFERELQDLQQQQEAELAAVEAGLRKCHSVETESLRAEHWSEMEELRTQQQEQMEEVTVSHQAAIQELRDMHNITMATLHEEHARTMRDLRKAHEQQKVLLEEDFEKLRLSLQDQVDTLTFQNQSLRDKAKRFEEALRRSTDEQIVDALAPYQHIEQDLKSLKEVVEMKNQQIHQQEKKITDLERVAQKNVFLEEKIQVLQQQNEDLKARIDMNLTLSRQLSEENANLHESVEKESTEKKRLSRNNEELLWRLQTSPLMSPSSSPLHRSFSTSPVPSSPFHSSSPLTGCESPTHCHGCPQQAQYFSPSHRVLTNQNLSPGPTTPTHRAASNQNYSPGPATPTHRSVTNQNYSPGPSTPTHRAVACLGSAQR